MQFVVLDLEWNNTYAKKAKGYINEIIEISKSNTILDSIKDYQLLRNIFGLGKSLSWSKKKRLFSAWDLIKDNSEETQAQIIIYRKHHSCQYKQ